jgi:voltage-gated potassium channel
MVKGFHPPKLTKISHVKSWFKSRLMGSVIVTLTLAWIGVAYWVYSIESLVKDSNIKTYEDGLWWGIVTFLTVGYGDRFPITLSGRLLAIVLMVIGVITMSIVTAKISSYFLEQALAKGRRTVMTDKLNNHFVICGWKEDMEALLEHIAASIPDLEPNEIVIVAPISEAIINSIKQHPVFSEVQLVAADFIHETHLRRAAPQKARRILILADQTPTADGHIPSDSEVDARTIMCSMILAQIARGVLVAAEVLDPKMDHFLKMANVSEVIYTREYSRLILGNATAGAGIANILYEILSPRTPVKIKTHAIPETLVGKSYRDMKIAWTDLVGGHTILGVLENTGNSDSIRHRALRNAQKTANMGELVDNLRKVKTLRYNNPIFSPPQDYVIKEGSLAIILETEGGADGVHGQKTAA